LFKENDICEIFSAVPILCSFLGKRYVSYFIVVCSDDRSHDTPHEQCYLQIPSPYNGSDGEVDENTHSPKTFGCCHHSADIPLLFWRACVI